jgi:hypothetical protein
VCLQNAQVRVCAGAQLLQFCNKVNGCLMTPPSIVHLELLWQYAAYCDCHRCLEQDLAGGPDCCDLNMSLQKLHALQ